ncbi:MAG: hypothetical protein GF331_06285 [Chitinivibrionales bacterium]|nr:hypothetical protein [Chitinivibrionales bacterium]
MLSPRVTVLVAVALAAQVVYAGHIDHVSNQSADYIRIGSRNAALDGADAAYYNPAGTALMEKGFYLQASNQSFLKDYTATYDGTEYASTEPSWIVPNAYALYTTGKWSAFFNFTAPAGGGALVYDDGLPMMAMTAETVEQGATMALLDGGVIRDQLIAAGGGAVDATTAAALADLYSVNTAWDGDLTGSSSYLGFTLGGAFAFTEKISVGLAARYVYSAKALVGEVDWETSLSVDVGAVPNPALEPLVTGVRDGLNNAIATDAHGMEMLSAGTAVDMETKATGVGAIVSVDYRPTESLNLALRFESPTVLEYTYTVNDGKDFNGQFEDGETERHDLPGIVGIGAQYALGNAMLTTSWNGYLLGWADTKSDERGADGYDDDYASLGYDLSLGAAYTLKERYTLSAGYCYTDIGGSSKTYTDFEYALDSHAFSGGAKLGILDNFFVTLAYAYSLFTDGESEDGLVTYDKSVHVLALGLELLLGRD